MTSNKQKRLWAGILLASVTGVLAACGGGSVETTTVTKALEQGQAFLPEKGASQKVVDSLARSGVESPFLGKGAVSPYLPESF